MSTLTQCRLKEVDGNGRVVSWIPTKHAVIGKKMTLEDLDTIYVVEEVHDTMEESYVRERGRDYRNTRKASDV